MERLTDELSPEHRALLRFLSRVHADNGAKKLQSVAAAMNLRSKSRVSHLLRGHRGTLPVDEAQLKALVRALGGGTDEVTRGLTLYARAKKAEARRAGRRSTRPRDPMGPPPLPAALIGRARELDRVRGWVDGLVAGRGQIVLVEGEPGIGKSSLVRAGAHAAATAGCHVFWATCDELSQAFPLLPLLDAVETRTPVDSNRTDAIGAATEHLLAQLADICSATPAMLVVDDLQWSDPATIVALGRLGRSVRTLPLLVVGITRSVPHREDLSALRRAVPPAAALHLEPLSEADVAELLARTLGRNPGPRLLRLAADATGNPLYMTELLGALVRSGSLVDEGGCVDAHADKPPDSLAAAIADRLEFLSSPVRGVLRTAALLGVRFSVDELAAASGSRTNELVPLLDEALSANVLCSERRELTFRHPLIRAALYEAVPAAVRAALHRDIGRALAEHGAPVERVARQLLPAVEASAATDEWTIGWLAGASHQLVGQAPQAAVPLLRQALSGIPPGIDLHDVLVCRLADALYRAGDTAGAANVATGALAYVTRPDLLVDLQWTLSQSMGTEGRAEESLAVAEQALNSPSAGPQQRARLLVLAARAHLSLGHLGTARWFADEALAEATAVGDHWTATWALGILSMLHVMQGDAEHALPLFDRAIASAERDPALADLLLMLHHNRAATLGDLDRYDDAISAATHARQLADDAGNVVRLAHSQIVLAELYFDIGRWHEALAEIEAASGRSKDPGVEWAVQGIVATILLHRGDDAAARDLLDAGERPVSNSGRVIGPYLLARSLQREYRGLIADALAILLDALSQDDSEVEEPADLFADAVRLALVIGDGAAARGVVSRAEALARDSDVPHRRAVAAHCRGLLNRDPAQLLAAADLYRTAGRPLPRAQALEAAAAASATAGDLAAARIQISEAASLYATLGAQWDLQRLRTGWER